MRRLTQEYVYAKIKEKNITLLTDYKNVRTKIHVKCDICNYEWDVNPNTLLNNVCGCPQCSNNAKITISQFKKELHDFNLKLKNNDVFPENFNSKTNIEVTCLKCGCNFSTSYNKIKKSEIWMSSL